MSLLSVFDADISVSNVANHDELGYVLRELQVFDSDSQHQQVSRDLQTIMGTE